MLIVPQRSRLSSLSSLFFSPAPGSFSRQSTGDAETSESAEAEPEGVAGCVWDLSQRHKGCRLVQKALENCGEAERAVLAQVGWAGVLMFAPTHGTFHAF